MILILLHALVAVIIPGLTAIAVLLACLAAFIGSLLAFALQSVLYRRQQPRGGTPPAAAVPAVAPPGTTPADGPPPPPAGARHRRFSLWSRRILISSAAITALLLAGLAAVNQWFLGDVVRALLERQRIRTGIAITASEVGGNLFSGRFLARGIVITRSGHDDYEIALTVHSLEAVVPVWRVLARTISIDSVVVTGVRGSIARGIPALTAAPPAGDRTPGGQIPGEVPADEEPTPSGRGAKRRFEIAGLDISDVNITFFDRTRRRPFALSVKVDALSAHPLRSRWAVSDLLLRASSGGTINGRPFRIATAGEDLDRTTAWSADGVPVALLATQIGGPFDLLSDGSCDVTVHSHWRDSPEGRLLVMDWSLMLDHVTAALPERPSPVLAELAKPAIAYFNGSGLRLPLTFTAEIPEDRFDGAASLGAAGMWQLVGDACAVTLAKRLGLDPERIKALGRSAVEKTHEVLDRWHRKPNP